MIAFFATPLGRWLVVAVMVAALSAFSFFKGDQYRGRVDDALHAKEVQQQLQAQVAATQRTLTEEHRRTDAVQEIANDTRQQAEHYEAAAADNRAAGERLRGQLAAANERASTAQSAAAAGGQAADTARRVLADVQRRLEEAEDRTIEFADASRRAGLACERIYETVTPKD